MFFEITTETTHASDLSPGITWVTWTYRQGTEQKPGVALCRSVDSFPSEDKARGNIATARKAFGGARFAKVVTV